MLSDRIERKMPGLFSPARASCTMFERWLRGQESNLTRAFHADIRCSMILAVIHARRAYRPFGILRSSLVFDFLMADFGHA